MFCAKMLENSPCVLERPWPTDMQVVHQLEDMKEQTNYMTEFRSALKYALEEVQTLRSELAEEKTKGLDEISSHAKLSKEIDIRMASTTTVTSGLHKSMTANDESQTTAETEETKTLQECLDGDSVQTTSDADLVIAEASNRIDRIRKKVMHRNTIITKLRKQLQKSSLLLRKREDKLEQKIKCEKELKSKSENLLKTTDKYKLIAESATEESNQAKSGLKEKDAEISALQKRLEAMQQQVNSFGAQLYEKDEHIRYYRTRWEKERDYALYKHRECDHLHRCLEDMKYRMQQMEGERRGQGNHNYSQRTQPTTHGEYVDARNLNLSGNYANERDWHVTNEHLRTNSYAHRSPRQNNYKPKATNRAHILQQLSPIQEDSEETKSTTPQIVIPTESSVSSVPDCSFEVKLSDLNEEQKVVDDFSNETSPSSVSKDTNAYPYLVVDTGSTHKHNVHSSKKQVPYSVQDDMQRKLVSEGHRGPQMPSVNMQDQSDRFGTSSSSPCSSVFSAVDESRLSDVTTISCQSTESRVKKSSKTKTKRKSSRHIRYCGHKIDVTSFSMQDFREIMWALSAEEHSVDHFLDYLAANAKRLQNDPLWMDKHVLGSDEDWLNLKGCY